MKIMLVNTYYFPEIVGGAEYSVKKLAEGLKRSGYKVVVLCTGSSDKREIIDGIEVIRFKSRIPCRAISTDKATALSKIGRRIKDIWNLSNEKQLQRVIKEEKPDVIHTNGLYDISPIIWKVAKKYGIHVVHTLRDYYLCCPHVSMNCEDGSRRCKLKSILCPVHKTLNTLALKKYVDVLTAPSSVTLNKVVKTMGLQEIASTVIPNAIDFDLSEIKEILKNKSYHMKSIVRYVYLGTLTEKKGVLWLLESFELIENQNVELYIAGKGELEDVVKDYCNNDTRIHFEGFLNESEMNKLLEKMDVLICPSLWEEPFGRVVLDAYKHAMPVIASDRGALPEIVDDRITGRIIKKDEELAKAITFFSENLDLIKQYGENAIEKLNDYSIEKQVALFVSMYEREITYN